MFFFLARKLYVLTTSIERIEMQFTFIECTRNAKLRFFFLLFLFRLLLAGLLFRVCLSFDSRLFSAALFRHCLRRLIVVAVVCLLCRSFSSLVLYDHSYILYVAFWFFLVMSLFYAIFMLCLRSYSSISLSSRWFN